MGTIASLQTLFSTIMRARHGTADMALANAVDNSMMCILLDLGAPSSCRQRVSRQGPPPMLTNVEPISLTVSLTTIISLNALGALITF